MYEMVNLEDTPEVINWMRKETKTFWAEHFENKWQELLDLADSQAQQLQRLRTVIAEMKSNQDTHKNYILKIEKVLDDFQIHGQTNWTVNPSPYSKPITK